MYLLPVQSFIGILKPTLLKHAQSADEGVRALVAECLGKLAISDPEDIFSMLTELVQSSHKESKGMISILSFITTTRARHSQSSLA